MHGRPPSQPLLYTHSSTYSTSHPTTAMIPLAWHLWEGWGQERHHPATAELSGLFCPQGSPTEPWVPLSYVLSLEHTEWPCAEEHPLEMLLPGPFSSPSKVQPYCRFLSANPGADFPQKQRKILYLKGPH